MPIEERMEYVKKHLTTSSDTPFPEGAFKSKADISVAETAVVLTYFGTVMGGPIALFAGIMGQLLFGTWKGLAGVVGFSALLALHPLPNPLMLANSRLTLMFYTYFSYRFMYVDDYSERANNCKGWVGAAAPHGVLPLANVLSMPAINAFSPNRFLGASASVVLSTPFLRYMTIMGGAIDVSASSVIKAVRKGMCVGLVPDGIAGIFQQKRAGSRVKGTEELVALKSRKGLAKLSLRNGIPLLPAYSLGNTGVFTVWYDRFGILEGLSRRFRMSIFVFWGRFGLPLPHRVNITMLFGRLTEAPEPTDKPSDEAVDELHAKLLQSISEMFEEHKGAHGWGDRTLRFV
eukprot:TRINITY_DN60821_c0_g1_i1.p1 TRINITY_DN60821_c0_g1~~TRINITY_DN60821_c0_g1_i1.p1  ORF type:complete len:393 (-),score=59.51 TRINITY_DN60821_c0_g1_i1:65-1102(-)